MINEFNLTNYLEEARGRVTEQFKDAPVFDKYLQLLIADSTELQLVLRDLMEKRSIDTAEGVQLDILGDIVGQPRVLIDADLFEYFGFLGAINAGSFGDLDDSSVGAPFLGIGETTTGNIVLDDDTYRLFIKAKIAKNNTRATPEDIMLFTNFIFNTQGSTVTDEGGAKFRLNIGRPLTTREVGLLLYKDRAGDYESTFLPKPIGVGVGYSSFDYDSFFAFDGVPNAKGFGDLYVYVADGSLSADADILADAVPTPNVGGKLATIHGEF